MRFPLMVATLLLASCTAPRNSPLERAAAPRSWTPERAAAHAARYNDPATWQEKRLRDDTARMRTPETAYLQALPFPEIAFPTPDYASVGWNCPGLGVGPIPMPEGISASAAWVCGPAKGRPAEPVCAILAAGPKPLKNVEQWCISRSHPHYLYQGTFRNEHGEIDWVALQMADGAKIAIINGRILDLGQGNVIFVKQMPDGSLRFLQPSTVAPPGDYPKQWGPSISALLKDPENLGFLRSARAKN